MVKALVAVSGGDEPSATPMVTSKDPATLGVPLRTPVVLDNDKPPGRDPEDTDHVSGVLAFVAVNVTGPYATSSAPFGIEAVVIAGGTSMVSGIVVVCWGLLLSVVWTVKLYRPARFGVPVMTPEGDNSSGGGSIPDPEMTVQE
jgi:hypothetical protein